MKPRNTLLLVVLAVLVGLGGWYFGVVGTRPSAPPLGQGQPAFPGLAAKLDKAAMVSITQGGKSFTLTRDGDAWRIAEKSGYPAQADPLHALLAGLSGLRLIEPRTSDPALYERLGVGDPAKDKDAALVRVLDAQKQPIAELIVGHRRSVPNAAASPAGEQVFVRLPGQAQSWLAEGRIDTGTDPTTWMGRDLTNINRDRMAEATLTHGDATLVFGRKDDKWALLQPEAHPPLDDSKVEDVARAYEYLVFTDVTQAAAQPGAVVGDSVFHTKDGLTLTAHVTKDGEHIWARFGASGADKAADEAKTLGKLFDGWAYEIGNWKLIGLAGGLDDFKAPPPKEEKPAADVAPGVAPGAAPEVAH